MEKKFRYLVPRDYMADPAVHVFDGKLYIYPSHDARAEWRRMTMVIILTCVTIMSFLQKM